MLKTQLKTQLRGIVKKAVPQKQEPSHLVYYDGGPASLMALREACEMASPLTKVVAVYLDIVPQEQELECARSVFSKAALAAAVVNGQLYGVDVETVNLPCHVKGPALVNLVKELGSTRLFMGVESSERDAPWNPFADYVLSLAPCQVVLVGV